MFNKDFYPTDLEVIERMCSGLTLKDKHVLEPSAGSGNLSTKYNKYKTLTGFITRLHEDLRVYNKQINATNLV